MACKKTTGVFGALSGNTPTTITNIQNGDKEESKTT